MSEDLTLPDAGYEHALDEFYAFLISIAERRGQLTDKQRIVLLNTVTPFSIVAGKPRYNNFILRAYGDLTIRRQSLTEAGSPKTAPEDVIDSANTGDAWSWEYFRFMFPKLQTKLNAFLKDEAVLAQIGSLRTEYDGQWKEYIKALDEIDLAWDKRAKELGIVERDDPEGYFEKKNEFFRKRRQYLQSLYDRATETLREILDLEIAHLDSDGILYKQIRDNLSTLNWVKLPIRPELENAVDSDVTRGPGDYDERPAMYPASGTNVFDQLLNQSADGDEQAQLQRGYVVTRNRVTTRSHDTDWSASGSARKMFFFKAKLSIAEKKHFQEQLRKVATIKVGFRAIDEVLLVRGRWYSGSFLNSAEVQEWLKKEPQWRPKLQHLITSLIVCRGLTVRLEFSSDIDQSGWRDLNVSGSGGLSVGGYNFGLKGHYHEHTEWSVKDVTSRSVVFADGPTVCRVLGFRVEQVLDDVHAPKGYVADMRRAAKVVDAIVNDYLSGKVNYSTFLEKVDTE